MTPLEELKQLEALIENASNLGTLKPIYDRLEEIARQNANDFEVQLAVADVREHLVHRGAALRRLPSDSPAADAIPVKPPINLRKALGIGAVLGVLGWLILFVTLVQIARNRNIPQPPAGETKTSATPPAAGTVPVDIVTTPPGATIQINNDTKCTSNCRVNLPPGNYQVTAMLDGYDPAATGVTVIPGAPINVSLALQNQAQTVRIYTDLPSGRVLLDGIAMPDLQDGQLVLDRVKNGKHKLQVFGPNNDAAFSIDLTAGRAPVIEGAPSVNNLNALFVSTFSNSAKIVTSTPPVKLALNGQPQGEITAEGLELKNVPAGDQQLTVGEGPDARKLVVSFGPMPTLTAFLKSDINSGTLVVSTGEDDVAVFLNGKEYRRKTRRGQLRLPMLGAVKVRVAKEGFELVPEQQVEVKKGEEARLAFKLKPLPQLAAIQIRGAAQGTQLLVDDRVVGRAAADGTLSAANLPPGDHMIELKRDGYVSKRTTRTLKAGETLSLGPAETALATSSGTIHLLLTPGEAQVSYRRSDEQTVHTARDSTLRLEPGVYLFSARAPGYLERTERVPVVAGETRNVELALAAEKVEAPKPKPAPAGASGATDWSGWTGSGGAYTRKGGNRVVVRTGALNGTLTFNAQLVKAGGLFRGGRLRFFIDDGEHTLQYEIDKKYFVRDTGREEDQEARTVSVHIDITPEQIAPRFLSGERWIALGVQPGSVISNGRFGFIIPGNDQIAISNFRFTPK